MGMKMGTKVDELEIMRISVPLLGTGILCMYVGLVRSTTFLVLGSLSLACLEQDGFLFHIYHLTLLVVHLIFFNVSDQPNRPRLVDLIQNNPFFPFQ